MMDVERETKTVYVINKRKRHSTHAFKNVLQTPLSFESPRMTALRENKRGIQKFGKEDRLLCPPK